jgi:hypothetical protein
MRGHGWSTNFLLGKGRTVYYCGMPIEYIQKEQPDEGVSNYHYGIYNLGTRIGTICLSDEDAADVQARIQGG